jgi:rubrerythrin
MKKKIVANEAFEIAELIEKNGASFYRIAAKNASNRQAKDLLLRLARMELDHQKHFEVLKEQYASEHNDFRAYHNNPDAVGYLHTIADSHVFNTREPVTDHLRGSEPLDKIILTALNFEKDTLVYFLGLKDLIREEIARGQVDKIIYEEVGHIGELFEMLRKL